MKTLITFMLLFAATIVTAQFEANVGVLATNIQDDDGVLAPMIGVKYSKSILPLFEVQGDKASLGLTASLDATYSKSFNLKVLPSVGVEFQFPLFVGAGITRIYNKVRSYIETGISVNGRTKISAKLMNYNVSQVEPISWKNPLTGNVIKFNQSIVFGVSRTF